MATDVAHAGSFWDDDAQLYQKRARWYDPATGRFIGEDPAAEGSNWYRYAGNDPVNFRDPTGLTQAGNPLNDLGRSIYGPINTSLSRTGSQQGSVGNSNFDSLVRNSVVNTSTVRPNPVSPTVFDTSILDAPALAPLQNSSITSLGNSSLQQRRSLPVLNEIDVIRARELFDPDPLVVSFHQALDVVGAVGSGLKTSGKALFNAGADTVVSLATLGFKQSPIRFTPTETDIANGFVASNLIARGSLEFLSGLVTGGLSQYGRVGRAVTVLDTASNVAGIGRASVDIAQNGLTTGNSLELIGSGFGLAGNLPEVSKLRVQVDAGTLSSGPLPLGGVGVSRAPSKAIHGNSLDYVGDTHVYVVKGPQGPHKIGESMQGTRVRDGASIRGEQQARALTRETGQQYVSEIRKTLPDKRSGRDYETSFIETLRRLFGEDTLPGNKTNR